MMILIEGLPKTGRTTLAKQLAWDLEHEYIPLDSLFRDGRDIVHSLIALIKRGFDYGLPFVLDGVHFTAIETGMSCRFETVEKLLVAAGAVLFMTVDSPIAIEAHLQRDGVLNVSRDQIGAQLDRYNRYFAASMLEPKATFHIDQLLQPAEGTRQPTDQYQQLLATLNDLEKSRQTVQAAVPAEGTDGTPDQG